MAGLVEINVDASSTLALFDDLPRAVLKRGTQRAMRLAIKPVVGKLKMQIAKEMASDVSKKGIRNYKASIISKVKMYKTGIYGGVGADTKKEFASTTHHKGKHPKTRWSRLAHLFEFGTSKGITPMYIVSAVQNSEKGAIINRFNSEIKGAIENAVKRHAKVKAMKK